MKDKILILLMMCLYGSVTSVQSSQAQFNPTYSNDGKYYMRDINGDTVYGYKNKDWFMFNGANLYLMQAPQGYMKVNSLHEVAVIDSIPYLAISGRPALFSGSYTDLTNKPTIPAQINPIQGTGISITGSYPNLTFASTVSAAVPVYNKSALLSSAAVFITDTFSITSSTPTISFASILSVAGKSSFKLVSTDTYRVGATALNTSQAQNTTLTGNSATYIVSQPNPATVNILGSILTLGAPLVPVPDPTNVKLIITLIAY